jgi:hypothetical protein
MASNFGPVTPVRIIVFSIPASSIDFSRSAGPALPCEL